MSASSVALGPLAKSITTINVDNNTICLTKFNRNNKAVEGKWWSGTAPDILALDTFAGMDSDGYLDILKKRVCQSRDWLGMDKKKLIFQQDNARTRTALQCMDFFATHSIKAL